MNWREPKFSEKPIAVFANRVLRRVRAAGDHTTTREDLVQECWIAWCGAVETFNPEKGVPFLGYLDFGMKRHINRVLLISIDRRHDEVNALSLEYQSADGTDGADGDMTFADVIPSAEPTQDDVIVERSVYERALTMMTPRTRQFIEILHDQPIDLLEEVARMEARADYSSTQGITLPHSHRLTKEMVFRLLGAKPAERVAIVREINEIGSKLVVAA